MSRLLLVGVHLLLSVAALPTVLVTGATGRTGHLLYGMLQHDPRVGELRALVTNRTKARQLLNCSRCDESEGIFIGDVTQPASLVAPMHGVDVLAIAVGVYGGPNQSATQARDVEFTGVENQVAALGTQAGGTPRRVVLCSSMGTTDPKAAVGGGSVLFYKLNAEAFLGSSGVGSAIVKPCGLLDVPGGKHALAVSHDDKLPTFDFTISRADVARVMAEAALDDSAVNLRFLLCNGKRSDPPTTDFAGLLRSARWPWEQ
ncbi:hypothetical protein AB1Y20_008835 [Prymnesium parvum]|uniref:NAD(P)-binding domain-containing protein n=1 Tax=Prymnesium parvum TaxID=97485 RepID=A0AB34IVP8_PRYPA